MLPSNPDRMNNFDFFFSPPTTVATSTVGNGDYDDADDWGEFVDSPLPPNQNGSDSTPKRIESEEKKSHGQWVTSRGPVPLSVFGEEDQDESGSTVSSFNFSFDSFSGKHKNDSSGSVNRVVNSNQTEGISGLIANLYRENGSELKNVFNSPEMNNNEPFSNTKVANLYRENGSELETSGVSLENMSWNPLNLDTQRSEKTSNVVNSSTIGVTFDSNASDLRISDKNDDDDDDDGWEFKTAQSMFQTADRSYKEEEEKVKSGSVWSLPTNGVAPSFDTGNAVESVFHRENGNADLWDNGEWEFKVAEPGEPNNGLTNKESNGWGFGFGFEPVSKIETTTSFQSNLEKEPQKSENGSNSFPSDANVNSGETSWAFKQPSLESGDGKEEKELQKDKPKGVLPLSFFEDEKSGTSDTLVHEDNLDSFCDFPVRKESKALSPTVSITDLISSLYSQVEEKNVVHLSEKSEKYEVVSVKAASDSNLVYGEDDSWEFQSPKTTIADSTVAGGSDDFDSTWEFQGPSLPLKSSDVTESVNEFDDDSWDFQGSTQPVVDSMSRKGDNGSWKYKHSSVENECGNDFSVSNGFRGSHEKQVVKIEPNDYQEFFNKLKTELYCIALNHLETLKGDRHLSGEAVDDRIRDGGIEELQKWLNNDVLRSEVNLESLQPRSSGFTELYKALQEPKFRALDSEDLLSERLLLAEKDWKSTIELLKYATMTLKIINLGSPEQQRKYASTWFAIASACAQELRHATSIWKQVIENGVQEEILSKPQGKSYTLCVWEIYRVAKILRTSIRLYKPWILIAPTSSNVLAVLDECVSLWLSSGLEEALRKSFDSDYSADQLLGSVEYLDEVDAFTLHTSITSATTPTCYISCLNTEMVPGMKTVEWNGEHNFLAFANLWANLISREPPSLPGHDHFPTVSS